MAIKNLNLLVVSLQKLNQTDPIKSRNFTTQSNPTQPVDGTNPCMSNSGHNITQIQAHRHTTCGISRTVATRRRCVLSRGIKLLRSTVMRRPTTLGDRLRQEIDYVHKYACRPAKPTSRLRASAGSGQSLLEMTP